KDGSPAQPEMVAFARGIVEHLEGVVKIILMAQAVDGLGALQLHHFREDEVQQAGIKEELKSYRRNGGEDDLVELVADTLFGYDADALPVFRDGVQGALLDGEAQLRGEADGPHHA